MRQCRPLGIALSPHRFGDALAPTQAIEDPARVLVVSQLFGHGDVPTANRACNQSRLVQALDAWCDVLDDLRNAAEVAMVAGARYPLCRNRRPWI